MRASSDDEIAEIARAEVELQLADAKRAQEVRSKDTIETMK